VNTEPPREDPDEPRSAAQNDLASKPGQRYQPEARYREDNELLTAARAAGPDSIEELMLSAQLERLGVRTLMRMTLDGSIFREWRVRKIRLRSFPERWREERRRVVHQECIRQSASHSRASFGSMCILNLHVRFRGVR